MPNRNSLSRILHKPILLPCVPRRTFAEQMNWAVRPLPKKLRAPIRRLAHRTRLWRRERLRVACGTTRQMRRRLDELSAEGVEGTEAEERVLAELGSVRRAAKRIRRERYRRGPLRWRMGYRANQVSRVLLLCAALYCIWPLTGFPNVEVDFLAEWNEEALAAPEEDRAWPLYERAVAAYVDQPEFLKDRLCGGEGSMVDDPDLLAWIEANAEAADLFVAAAKRPAYGAPYRYYLDEDGRKLRGWFGLSLDASSSGDIRRLALVAWRRARVRMGRGHFDEAWDDLLAVCRTGWFLQQRRPTVDQLVGVGIIACGASAARRAMFDNLDQIPDDRLRRWMAEWDAAVPGGVAPLDLRGEKDSVRDMVQRTFADGWWTGGNLSPWGTARVMADTPTEPDAPSYWKCFAGAWLTSLFHANRQRTTRTAESFWEAVERDMARPLHDSRRGKATEQFDEWFAGGALMKARHALWLTFAIMGPALERADTQMTTVRTDHRATAVCIALLAHRADTGAFPDSLAALVPDDLSGLPIDPFDGKPIKYRIRDDGHGFVLYSIAGDFQDGQGRVEHGWWPRQEGPSGPSATATPPEPYDAIFWPPPGAAAR